MKRSQKKYQNELENDILKIYNIDKLVGNENDSQKSQLHPLLPKHPFRLLAIGSSGLGKTSMAIQMICKQLCFDKIYVISRHNTQSKYIYLKNYLEDIEQSIEDIHGIKHKIIELWSDSLDELPDIKEGFNKQYRNLILIDDFNNLTKAEEKKIASYFCRCRHANASIILCNQLYFRTPRPVRLNLSHCVLFNNNNNREIQMLANELASDMDTKDFKKLYNKILDRPYQFMLVDNTATDKSLRYRRNWDELYGKHFDI